MNMACYAKIVSLWCFLVVMPVFASIRTLSFENDVASNCLYLVESFYRQLSMTPTNYPPDIFDLDTVGYRGVSVECEKNELWNYFVQNTDLFMSEASVKKHKTPIEFYQIAGKKISRSLSNGDYEVIVWSLAFPNPAGVLKEIAFPIVVEEKTSKRKIQIYNIRVNGHIIDPYGDFIRDESFLERLGLKRSKGFKP